MTPALLIGLNKSRKPVHVRERDDRMDDHSVQVAASNVGRGLYRRWRSAGVEQQLLKGRPMRQTARQHTNDINRVFKAVRRLNFGGVIINDTPSFRADHMPYGGNRQSGLGREGVKFAMEDMTNIQLVAIRLNS